jgi:hypothetical protein
MSVVDLGLLGSEVKKVEVQVFRVVEGERDFKGLESCRVHQRVEERPTNGGDIHGDDRRPRNSAPGLGRSEA